MKKKAIKCRDVYRHICDNLDQKLDSPECREIKRHLDGCPNCIAYLDSLKKTVLLYREYPHPGLPNRTRKKLHASLRVRLNFQKASG